jgi:hypothetical protein
MKTSNKLLIGALTFMVVLVITFLLTGKAVLAKELKNSAALTMTETTTAVVAVNQLQ